MVFQDVTAGYLTVSIDRSPLEQDIRDTLRFLVVSAVLLTSLGVMLASVLAHRLSRPIETPCPCRRGPERGPAAAAGRPPDEIGQVLRPFNTWPPGFSATTRSRPRCHAMSRRRWRSRCWRMTPIALGGSSVVGSVLFCDIVGLRSCRSRVSPPRWWPC